MAAAGIAFGAGSLWLWRMGRALEEKRNLEIAVEERTRELALEKGAPKRPAV